MLSKLLFLIALVALFAWFLSRRRKKPDIEIEEYEGPPKLTRGRLKFHGDPDPCTLTPRIEGSRADLEKIRDMPRSPVRNRPPLAGVTQVVPKVERRFGTLADKVEVSDDFDAPLRLRREEPVIAHTPIHLTFSDDSDRHRHHVDHSPTHCEPSVPSSPEPAPVCDDFKGGGGDFGGGGSSGSWD